MLPLAVTGVGKLYAAAHDAVGSAADGDDGDAVGSVNGGDSVVVKRIV